MDGRRGSAVRVGVEQARFAKSMRGLYLRATSQSFKDLELLESLLFPHGSPGPAAELRAQD